MKEREPASLKSAESPLAKAELSVCLIIFPF